ncbi:hypothetical protein [Actinotalea sp. C106]|uniref:hypothetical protein n=1 Tax=Actinotalea sp. C106 TaxID=2908644 RepID=UPI002027995F|nr:hypothetical protein [Actinotalea sp. C106]
MDTTTNDGPAYDPAQDPDADPENLTPRSGAAASGEPTDGDPDADPDMLNPPAPQG